MAPRTPPPKGPNTPATPALTFSSSTASPSTLATPRHPSDTSTPSPQSLFNQFSGGGTLKLSLKQRAGSESERSTAGHDNDDALDEEPEIPPWDRTVELVWTRRITTLDNKLRDDELSFQENSARLAAVSAILHPVVIDETDATKGKDISTVASKVDSEEGPEIPKQRKDVSGKNNCRYFGLPNRVRFKITKLVVKSHNSGKPVRVNSPPFLHPIWPVNHVSKTEPQFWSTDYFDSLETVLESLSPYTTVCFAMRVDFLTTMFLTRRFHVIYSPFVGEEMQKAATLYMDRYGPLMKWINLEIDMSKMAGSWCPEATKMDMSKTLVRVRERIEKFAESQLTRGSGTTLQSLIILVRRYHGFRPGTANGVQEKPPSAQDGERQNGSKENAGLEKEKIGGTQNESDDIGSSPHAGEKGKVKDVRSPQDEGKTIQEGENNKTDKGDKIVGCVDETPLSPEMKEDKRQGPEQHMSEARDKSGNNQGIPYCSDEYLTILDPIKKLGPLIDNLCMVGTSKSYANDFIEAIWGKDRPKSKRERAILCHYRSPPRAYPYTPGQRSAVDNGPRHGGIQIVQHETDPKKWVGVFGCLTTEDWEKYGPGPFIFKPSKIPTCPTTPIFPPHPKSPVVDSGDPKRRPSVPSRTNRRRVSASSLLSLITRNSTSTTCPGSIFGFGIGGESGSGSIPPLRKSPTPTLSLPTPPEEKKKSRRVRFFLPSKIPVLSKRHMLSPPGLRARLGLKKDKSTRPLPIPISLPYETGTLVPGSRDGLRGWWIGRRGVLRGLE